MRGHLSSVKNRPVATPFHETQTDFNFEVCSFNMENQMASNAFEYRASSLTGPATKIVTVIPSDTTDLPNGLTRGLYVGTAGSLRIEDKSGNIVDLNSVASQYHPLRVSRVHATGTTAETIVALY
jgi:hypothetical protein